MTCSTVPHTSAPVSPALDNLDAYHPADWDDEIVEVTDYQPQCNSSSNESITSDALSADLSDLENVVHDDIYCAIPYGIERKYSSSESEMSVADDEDVNEPQNEGLSILDYATVDQNWLDELMRFGLYEPGGESVHGVLIEPQPQSSNPLDDVNDSDNEDLSILDYATVDENGLDELMRFGLYESGSEPVHGVLIEPRLASSNAEIFSTNTENPSDAQNTADDSKPSNAHTKQMLSLMSWCNDESNSKDEHSDDQDELERSHSFSSNGSTVVIYEGPRVLDRIFDGGEVETLPDDDAGDIETLDSDWESENATNSERNFGEVETLDDSDGNSECMFDGPTTNVPIEDAATVVAKPDDLVIISHEENPVEEITRQPSTSTVDANTAPNEDSVDLSTKTIELSQPRDSIAKNSDTESQRPREDARKTRIAHKKGSKLKKMLTRMFKSCFSKSTSR